MALGFRSYNFTFPEASKACTFADFIAAVSFFAYTMHAAGLTSLEPEAWPLQSR